MSTRHLPTSAIVLAGGQSRRMGQDKRRLRLWGAAGPTLLEHTLAIVQQVCDEAVLVLNDAEDWPALPARCVCDIYADGGPLGGLLAGLLAAQHEYALVVACDMPLLDRELLRAMIARPRDYDVLIPRVLPAGAARNALEPLHAIYAKRCIEPIRAALESGQRAMVAFLPAVRVAYLGPEETQRYDPAGHSFLNLNTAAQLEQFEALLG